jgi:ribosome maturation factor RimP
MDILHDKLRALIAPVLQNFNADFVALELKGSRQNLVVRVVADQDGGITLPTCAAISRALSTELEVADIIPGRYRLEVSSPGTDWPLKSKRDFERNLGRQVNLHYRQDETAASIEGTIQQVSETEIVVASENGSVSVPLASVEVGRLKLKW